MNNKTDSLIYGRNPVKEALRSKRVKTIYLANGFSNNEVLSLIDENHINVTYKSVKELDSMTQGVHQGVAAIIRDYEYYSLESILDRANKQEKPLIVILDGINDPHNLGAILRCGDVFNVTGILIPKHNQVPLNATVAKTSAGAINYVPVALVGNLNQTIEKLKENGFWIVSTDGSGSYNYQDLKYDFKVALVIGSEGQGVSRLVLNNSDYVVKIPQFGHVNSLNASVAAGILLAKIRE
jgi:23S rRNA (guanosine2251-2'-O)-methyltransferase